MSEDQPHPTGEPNTWAPQMRRYWWVVTLVVLLSVAGAVISTTRVETTYTGRASLIVSSPNRSPDQDAVLVQGYVDYFNNGAYEAQLLDEAGLTQTVTLSARAAAASPILLIESTSPNAAYAQRSAAAVARAFRSDINAGMEAEQQKQISQLQARIAGAKEENNEATASSVASLQQQIGDLQGDTTNRLQELQFQGGVAVNSPNTTTNLVFSLFGGLLLGLLAALALARLAGARAVGRRDTSSQRQPRGPRQ